MHTCSEEKKTLGKKWSVLVAALVIGGILLAACAPTPQVIEHLETVDGTPVVWVEVIPGESALPTTETLFILIFGVLLVGGVSWVILRGRKQKEPQSKRPQATRQTVGRAPTVSPTTRPRPASPFADVQQQVEALRRQVAGGLLTEEECKAQMRDLMVEDADGNWWMVGYETGEWYRHDGTDWVRADPPVTSSGERSTGGAQ